MHLSKKRKVFLAFMVLVATAVVLVVIFLEKDQNQEIESNRNEQAIINEARRENTRELIDSINVGDDEEISEDEKIIAQASYEVDASEYNDALSLLENIKEPYDTGVEEDLLIIKTKAHAGLGEYKKGLEYAELFMQMESTRNDKALLEFWNSVARTLKGGNNPFDGRLEDIQR